MRTPAPRVSSRCRKQSHKGSSLDFLPALTNSGFPNEKSRVLPGLNQSTDDEQAAPGIPPAPASFDSDNLPSGDNSPYVDPGSPPPYEWPFETKSISLIVVPLAIGAAVPPPPVQAAAAPPVQYAAAAPSSPALPRVAPSGPAQPTEIRFNEKGGPYHGFSNYSLFDVEFEGRWYATGEHLFQAMKVLVLLLAWAEPLTESRSS